MKNEGKPFWIYKHTEHGQRVEAGPYTTWEDANKACNAHDKACPRADVSIPFDVPADHIVDRG